MSDKLKSHGQILVKIMYKLAKPGQEWSRRVYVTDTDCLWQTKIGCDWHRLSVTDTGCLWQTQTVCDRHQLPVTEADSLWPEFLNVTVSWSCARAKFSWPCAKSWDLYAQTQKLCILTSFRVISSWFTHIMWFFCVIFALFLAQNFKSKVLTAQNCPDFAQNLEIYVRKLKNYAF